MNIAKIMIPKISTVFLYEKDTIRQGLERFMVVLFAQMLGLMVSAIFV